MSQKAESFGKYILLEKIAMGGMAEVYLAKNQGASGIAKFVAIKRILPQFSENANFIDMFKTEARIAVNLAHSNIVSIHEFGVEKEQFYIVMDYVEGRNVRQILNKMKKGNVSFSIEQVLYIIKEIAGGLDHAHRCLDGSTGKPLNIIHRDMSPQNVMINFEGEVKIVDFGIAKAETQIETTRAGELKGKFGYMSPEQAEGQTVDLRTDIFSLGIVLWELLANDRLFIANNEVNTLRKIRECQIPSLRKINPNIPQELERIVSKALAKDRNLRYQTSAALHRELSRFLNRQYPDFSSHDFSIFIKTLFASDILESRKKQIEYAKIEIAAAPPAPPPVPEKTIVTGQSMTDKGVTETETEAEVNTNSHNGLVDFENGSQERRGPPKRATLIENEAPEAEKEKKKPAPAFKVIKEPDQDLSSTQLRVQYSSPFRDVREGTFTNTTTTNGTFNSTFYGSRSSISRSSKKGSGIFSANFLVPLVVLGCMAGLGGTYLYNPEKTYNWVIRTLVQMHAMKPSAEFPAGAVLEEASSRPPLKVPVFTTPPGAEVFIDGVSASSDVTPTTLIVPWPTDGRKVVKFSFKAHGYNKLEEYIDLEKVHEIHRVLQTDRHGYLNVTVVGNAEIKINNRLVATSSPANNIEVPADEDVVVTAYDPATHLFDQRVIQVGENRVQSVTLIPRVQKSRHPASPPPP